MTDKLKNTGIIGLGAMGYQMARHMVNKGFAVAGYDVAPVAAQRAMDAGVNIVDSPAEVGASAEVVIVMVATDAQVEDVVLDPACWTGWRRAPSSASPAPPRPKPRANWKPLAPNAG